MSTKTKEVEDEDMELPLPDFEPDEPEESTKQEKKSEKKQKAKKGEGYTSVNSSGFRDFLLKPEILKGIVDSGFEHPSEVQHKCLPQAILGMDMICQAKAGMGKTAVFVLSVLQQLEPVNNQCQCLVLCHTRELAYQCCKEFIRFSKYLPDIKTAVYYGGININVNIDHLKNETANIVVGTPGRLLALIKEKHLNVSKVRHFILDECDKMLESLDMRQDIQTIFEFTPREKQVMMFSATFNKFIRKVAKKFMSNPSEIYVDNESKLVLHGLQQYFVKLGEREKNKKLHELLDALEFNQVVIFVRSKSRARDLNQVLVDSCFPSICIHSKLPQEERIKRYKSFKNFEKRILVATDLFGRGIDIERVNIVINYDMAEDPDSYLHRVGRAGRFGTKGLAISFISKDDVGSSSSSSSSSSSRRKYVRNYTDSSCLDEIQKRFIVKISPLPDKIDISSYMTS